MLTLNTSFLTEFKFIFEDKYVIGVYYFIFAVIAALIITKIVESFISRSNEKKIDYKIAFISLASTIGLALVYTMIISLYSYITVKSQREQYKSITQGMDFNKVIQILGSPGRDIRDGLIEDQFADMLRETEKFENQVANLASNMVENYHKTGIMGVPSDKLPKPEKKREIKVFRWERLLFPITIRVVIENNKVSSKSRFLEGIPKIMMVNAIDD